MNYDYASAMADHIGIIQQELNTAIKLALSKADPGDYEFIKKSLGMAIARLDMEILWPIYRAFPDLDPSDIPVPPPSLLGPSS